MFRRRGIEPAGRIGFRRCIVLSTHYRSTHSLSRCERALYDLDRRRFPLPDELTPAADHGAFAARDLPAAPPVPGP